MVEHLRPDVPAKLFRKTGFPGQSMESGTPVAGGTTREMVAQAVADPLESWRYSIQTEGHPLYQSHAIEGVAKQWGLLPG